jgi:soluble lytic murein transglycosylase
MRRSRIISLLSLALFLLAAPAFMSGAGGQADAKTPPKAGAKVAPKTTPKAAAHQPAKAAANTNKHIPLPRPRPQDRAAGHSIGNVSSAPAEPIPLPVVPPVSPAEAAALSISPNDLNSVKEALGLVRRGNIALATVLERSIKDPVAAKVVEWLILRSDSNSGMSFDRFAAFLRANPHWPSVPMLTRRAEAALWDDQRESGTVRAFFAHQKPTSAKGRFVLARTLLANGDRKAAETLVREAWRSDGFSREVETTVLNLFGDMLTRADHKARMDSRFYAADVEAGMRAAQRLDNTEMAIAKARTAVIRKAGDTKAALDAVPAEARRDPGYLFHRIQWLRRSGKVTEAAQLMLTAPQDATVLHDLDQWWMERRYLVRDLLDLGDAQSAFRIARDTVSPTRENYRVDHNFTAGWIALRYLHDPTTALVHFNGIPAEINNPHALARAGYWKGRALEALGRGEEARAHYEAAARHSTVYYGQIARAKLGLPDLPLRSAPPLPADRKTARMEVVRAAEILYAIDERDLIASMMADLGERTTDVGVLAALGEVTARYKDPRGMLLLGKAALGRGFAFDYYAYPTVGLPSYTPIGPPIDPSVVYSIVRQESSFNQKDLSSAMAMGLMQVTPAAGRDTAKKFRVVYDQKRLMSDQVYNMQIGAGELGILFQDYRGSYILTFAGYNAGRGRVKEWVARFGDPRDPKIDPIDWVERIPFAETRNYVQRILENLQVYRVRFGGGSKLLIEADLHRGTRTE